MSDLIVYVRDNINKISVVAERDKVDAIKRLRTMFYNDGTRNHVAGDLFVDPMNDGNGTSLGLLEAKFMVDSAVALRASNW
jgi:hypothetical protein